MAERPPRVGNEERLCRLVRRGDARGTRVLPARGRYALAFHRPGEHETGNRLAHVDVCKANVEQKVTHGVMRVEGVDRLRETCGVWVFLGTKAEHADIAILHHPMDLAQVLFRVVSEVEGVDREHPVEMGV